jgi:asparagine synthase (glutamine-hydrolysing)
MLDGQGADELLAGYFGYPGYRILSLLETGRLFDMLRFAKNWSQYPDRDFMYPWMWLGRIVFPDKIYGFGRKILGRDFMPNWLKVDMLREAGVTFKEVRPLLEKDKKGRRVIERLIYALQKRGLPALLRHADRNSMHFSIESRVPFLTTPMADLLLSLPEHYLISNNGETKSVFRAAMRGLVPDNILDRKDKIGFATPEKDWFVGMAPKLREWLQSSSKIPFIDKNALMEYFDSIFASRQSFNWQVWRWVNFARWYELMIHS